MKFLFYTSGDRNKASSRVRAYWLADALKANGISCSLEHRHSLFALCLFALRIPFCDILFFQKTYSRWHCLLLRVATFCRKKTILDLDDSPSRTNNAVTMKNVEYMMQHVSTVVVGSAVLAEYARQYQGNVNLIPSSIYLKYYQSADRILPSADEKETVCLGWIGNGGHYKEDLISILREPLTLLAQKYSIKFKLIGACGEKVLHDEFNDIPELDVEIIDQIDWSDPTAVSEALCDIDVGLYPLLPNEFNKYKCGFKALEYMAMSIPVVSSNVAENREIIENNVNGLFADSVDDWGKALDALISEPELRVKMGQAGRKLVEEQYSVAGAVNSLLKLI